VSIRILQSSAECNDQMAPSEWAGFSRGSTGFYEVLRGSAGFLVYYRGCRVAQPEAQL